MKAIKRRIQLTFLIGLTFIVLIFLQDYWGISEKQNQGVQGVNAITADSVDDNKTVFDSVIITENANDSIKENELVEIIEEDSLPINDTTLMDSIISTPLDTLVEVKKDSVKAEIEFNLIEVKRLGADLYYVINGQETDNLVAGLTLLELDKEVILKMSGNITYAEGQEVKNILDVKEIKYSESSFKK